MSEHLDGLVNETAGLIKNTASEAYSGAKGSLLETLNYGARAVGAGLAAGWTGYASAWLVNNLGLETYVNLHNGLTEGDWAKTAALVATAGVAATYFGKKVRGE